MASGNVRRRNARHHAKATAIVVATVLFANIVAVVGLGSAALAGDIHTMTPYAPLAWEKDKPFVERPGIQTVASVVRIDRNALGAAGKIGDRGFAEIAATKPKDRVLVVIVMIAALCAMVGISARMFRGLLRDFENVERKRRDFMR